MLPSGSWLHIAIGFVFGAISTIFTILVVNLLKKDNAAKKLIGAIVLFSFSISLVSFVYASTLSGGLLVEWQLLGFPQIGDHAVKVVDIGYVQAQSGNIYHFTCLGCREGNWEQVGAITKNEEEYFIPSPGTCGTLSFLPLLRKEFIDSKSACVAWGPAIAKVAYAVDDGGRVYSWSHGVGEYGGIEKLFFPIIGGTMSCVFGIIIILLLVFSGFLKNKMQRKSSQSNSIE